MKEERQKRLDYVLQKIREVDSIAGDFIMQDFLEQEISLALQDFIEKIWDMLIMSLPPDAENLSTAVEIPTQAQAVLRGFINKLNNK